MSSGQSVWVEKEAEIWRFGSDAKMQMVQTTATEDDEAEEAADNEAGLEEKGEKGVRNAQCTMSLADVDVTMKNAGKQTM